MSKINAKIIEKFCSTFGLDETNETHLDYAIHMLKVLSDVKEIDEINGDLDFINNLTVKESKYATYFIDCRDSADVVARFLVMISNVINKCKEESEENVAIMAINKLLEHTCKHIKDSNVLIKIEKV